MSCLECGAKVHARKLCPTHYMAWYRLHPDEARRKGNTAGKQQRWKFTPDHWWKWWDKRAPDLKTLERRADIQAMRRALP